MKESEREAERDELFVGDCCDAIVIVVLLGGVKLAKIPHMRLTCRKDRCDGWDVEGGQLTASD